MGKETLQDSGNQKAAESLSKDEVTRERVHSRGEEQPVKIMRSDLESNQSLVRHHSAPTDSSAIESTAAGPVIMSSHQDGERVGRSCSKPISQKRQFSMP